MQRARLCILAAVVIALPLVVGACGDDGMSGGTLPPLITTTTSTTLDVTSTTTPEFYEIQSGDTLDKIASQFGVSREALIAINGITDPDHIEVGQRLQIPQPGAVVVTTTLPTGAVTSTTLG